MISLLQKMVMMMTCNGSDIDDDKSWWWWQAMVVVMVMTKDDDDDVDTIYTCWTVVWCMLDQGWSGTVNCKHSHHSFNWSQLIVLIIVFNLPNIQLIFQVFSKNNIWLHLKIPMANPNGMDYRFWQNPNLTKGAFPFIFLPRCRAMHVRLSEACWLPESKWGSTERQIQNFADRKSKAATKDKSGDGNLAQSLDFVAEEVVRANYSFHHNNFRKNSTKQETTLSSSFLWLFMQSETIFEVPDMRRHSRQKIVFARNFLGIFCRVVLTREEKKRGLRRQTKAGKVST